MRSRRVGGFCSCGTQLHLSTSRLRFCNAVKIALDVGGSGECMAQSDRCPVGEGWGKGGGRYERQDQIRNRFPPKSL